MEADPDRIEALVESARRLSPGERRAFLDGFRLDEESRRAVERALESDRTVAWKPGGTPATGADAPRAAPAPLDPLVGRDFAGVGIERVVGSGGMGRVYLGIDRATGARVALKVLLRTQRDESVRRRFDREGRLLERLRHPGIAAVLRTGIEQDGDVDVPFIVMEYVEGAQGLSDHVFSERLGPREAVQEFLQACDALGHAHREGYVHRDIKPANILVDRHGRVKVIDFGVARAISVDPAAATVRTETGQLVGTMQYMSPEQFMADPRGIDARTDVYALSAVLYELLAGVQPHDLRGLPVHEAARTVCETDVADIRRCNPRIDDRLAGIVMDGLSRLPARRPEDAGALALRLRGWLGAGSQSESPPREETAASPRTEASGSRAGAAGPRGRAGSASGRPGGNWTAVGLVAVLVLAAIAVAFGFFDLRAVFMHLRGGGQGAPSAAPSPPSAAVRELRVVTAPAGAQVRVDGEPRGAAPCVVLLPDGGGPHELSISLKGWNEQRVSWKPGDAPLLAVNLSPAAAVDAMPRVFILDVAPLPAGTSLELGSRVRTDPPGQGRVPSGISCVELWFTREGHGWRCREPLALVARRADGSAAEIEAGASRGTGTLRLDLPPEAARDPLRVRVR